MPDPGERPERSRKLVKALLEKPLKTLHVDANGYLLIPTPDEVGQTLQATELSKEAEFSLNEWRERFPRLVRQEPTQQPMPQEEQHGPPPLTDATESASRTASKE